MRGRLAIWSAFPTTMTMIVWLCRLNISFAACGHHGSHRAQESCRIELEQIQSSLLMQVVDGSVPLYGTGPSRYAPCSICATIFIPIEGIQTLLLEYLRFGLHVPVFSYLTQSPRAQIRLPRLFQSPSSARFGSDYVFAHRPLESHPFLVLRHQSATFGLPCLHPVIRL